MSRNNLVEALNKAPDFGPHTEHFFKKGRFNVDFYKPGEVDEMKKNKHDTLFFITSGDGHIFNNGKQHPVEQGEVIFVKAGKEHKFFNFSLDFTTWVVSIK
ncbi:cupin domain-containing protein [Thiomicrorhabdus sp.]|uniref:cupin domain-containing protein n=1 Tax=Thiomicrorhabdus sp. TaxID=2039724 RepID=UPI0029C761BB|nr:cupin domain-containing protein [Thiomicrorhabdus sp.]